MLVTWKTWLMRLICVFSFDLLGHIAQPPGQGRTTVRTRQTHGLYTLHFRKIQWSLNPKIWAKSSRKMRNINLSQLYRIFIATLSLFFCRKMSTFMKFSHSNAKKPALSHPFVPNASHDKCWMTLSKSKLSGQAMCLLVFRYTTTSPIFASSQRSVQSKLSKNWCVGARQPTWPAQATAVQVHGRQGNPMGWFGCFVRGQQQHAKMESHLWEIYKQITPPLGWEGSDKPL